MTSEAKGTYLLINKEDSSDDEMQSNDRELDNLQKNSTDPGGEEEYDDSPYEEDAMFSDDNYEGFTFVQDIRDISCNMNNKAGIPDSWILLKSQSTVDVFMNKKLLKNIHDAKKPLSLHRNAGMAIVNKVGDLAGYGIVWYYEGGIANILSLNNVKKK